MNSSMATEAVHTADRSFVGHPRGLAYLSFAEGWERFSYYGMQTLLVLYMVRQLLLPGHIEHIAGFAGLRAGLEWAYGGPLSNVALASAIFGLYTGLVYLTPIGGGIVADRWMGRTPTITIGALLMAAGHFLMAFDASFLVALTCLLIGVGCFKGNIATQVGALYAPEDLRRADAFQIYFLFINAAVIVAPLIAGTLGESYGWHYGFAVAGFGMLISLVVYRSGRKWLPPEPQRASTAAPRQPLNRQERIAVLVLIAILPVIAVGAVGNQQIFNAYLLWVPDHVDLVFFGHRILTTWLITLDAAVSVSCLVGAVAFWRLWSRRFPEPNEVMKLSLGMGISLLGLLCLVAAAAQSAGGHRAGFGWVLGFELLNSFGFANTFPVGLALYARASPKVVAGTMIGVYYIHLFAANNLVGWLGGLVERLSGTQFWLLHAALVGGAALAMFITGRLFGPLLAPRAGSHASTHS
ncbi:MAG TPA: peptide MFS transporter [Steroidobacteraceae bacterium]|nr:peptide MFS transporter [Steroidobacteraceae bacterium]